MGGSCACPVQVLPRPTLRLFIDLDRAVSHWQAAHCSAKLVLKPRFQACTQCGAGYTVGYTMYTTDDANSSLNSKPSLPPYPVVESQEHGNVGMLW